MVLTQSRYCCRPFQPRQTTQYDSGQPSLERPLQPKPVCHRDTPTQPSHSDLQSAPSGQDSTQPRICDRRHPDHTLQQHHSLALPTVLGDQRRHHHQSAHMSGMHGPLATPAMLREPLAPGQLPHDRPAAAPGASAPPAHSAASTAVGASGTGVGAGVLRDMHMHLFDPSAAEDAFQYRKGECLGKGAFGVVYRCEVCADACPCRRRTVFCPYQYQYRQWPWMHACLYTEIRFNVERVRRLLRAVASLSRSPVLPHGACTGFAACVSLLTPLSLRVCLFVGARCRTGVVAVAASYSR